MESKPCRILSSMEEGGYGIRQAKIVQDPSVDLRKEKDDTPFISSWKAKKDTEREIQVEQISIESIQKQESKNKKSKKTEKRKMNILVDL